MKENYEVKPWLNDDVQNVNGLKKLVRGGSGGVTVEPVTFTENGTFTAPAGKAYSPVTVNVAGGSSPFSDCLFYTIPAKTETLQKQTVDEASSYELEWVATYVFPSDASTYYSEFDLTIDEITVHCVSGSFGNLQISEEDYIGGLTGSGDGTKVLLVFTYIGNGTPPESINVSVPSVPLYNLGGEK